MDGIDYDWNYRYWELTREEIRRTINEARAEVGLPPRDWIEVSSNIRTGRAIRADKKLPPQTSHVVSHLPVFQARPELYFELSPQEQYNLLAREVRKESVDHEQAWKDYIATPARIAMGTVSKEREIVEKLRRAKEESEISKARRKMADYPTRQSVWNAEQATDPHPSTTADTRARVEAGREAHRNRQSLRRGPATWNEEPTPGSVHREAEETRE